MVNMDKETTGQSCRKCDAADNESMVQCDTCDAWYHFNCVGVHSNVADESWSCESCQNHASTTNAHPTASSSPTTKQGNRHVNFLPTFPTIAKISNSTVNPLLKPATNIANSTVTTATPVSTNFSTWASSNWNFEPSTSVQGSQLPNKSSEYNPGLQQFTTGSIATSANEISYSQPKVFSSVQQVGIRNGQGMQMPFNSEIYRNLQLEKLEEQMKLQQQYLDNKYKILSQYNDLPSSSTSMASFSNGPTPGQLAARQAIPKQLPTFNGDPEEWPLFISSFDNSTTVAGYTDAENLIRLQASLKGKAREMVKCKLFLPSMVPEIIKTLRMCFGRPEHILERAMNKARAMPALKDKLEGLIEFALCVRNICATMEGCQMYMHLHNPLLVKELVDKLPNNQKLNWAVHPKDEKTPVVKQFSDWLYNLAEAASTVVSLAPAKSSATVNTHTIDVNTQHPSPARNIPRSKQCIICKSNDHKVMQCDTFKKFTLQRKWEEVKANNLCRQCLNPHRRKCLMNKVCGVDGCTIKHNPLLHKTITVMSQQKPIAVSTNTNKFLDAQINTHSSSHEEMQPLFRIVPIRIYSKNKVLNIFAFLDEGSSVTLMEKIIFDK